MAAYDSAEQLTTVPPDVRRLLETTVTTFVRWDLLTALAEEGLPMSLEELAVYVGREPASLIPELGALVSRGVVERIEEFEHTDYRLHRERQATVEHFVALCEESDIRLSVIARVVNETETVPDDADNEAQPEPGSA